MLSLSSYNDKRNNSAKCVRGVNLHKRHDSNSKIGSISSGQTNKKYFSNELLCRKRSLCWIVDFDFLFNRYNFEDKPIKQCIIKNKYQVR